MVPEMDEERRARVRKFLLDRFTVGSRNRSKSSSRWLGWLFGSTPRTLHAFEHDDCVPDRALFCGEIQAAWLIGPEGIQPLAMPGDPTLERPGDRRFVFPRFDFYIAPAGDWIIESLLSGPRAGCGGRYRVVPNGDGFKLVLEGPHWKA
jgi:hypothetical protein